MMKADQEQDRSLAEESQHREDVMLIIYGYFMSRSKPVRLVVSTSE